MKNLIILPDGTEIYSGNARDNAIISCTYIQCVNDGTELSIGSACCNELELKLFLNKGLSIAAGDEITYYNVADNGTRKKIGVFYCEKPTRSSSGTYKFTAYDRVSWLDKDLSDWLAGLNGWPYTLIDFAKMVCAACSLTLATVEIPNQDYQIRAFSASGITGRQLMKWVGEICGRFVRSNPAGEIELAWYSDNGAEVKPNASTPYIGGSLSYEDYIVAEIGKVQIQVTEDDLGTVWPETEENLNTYKITGNYLLTAETGDELKPVAEVLYEQLKSVHYTPCKVSVWASEKINAGDIVLITDRSGVEIVSYVMQKTRSGQRDTLECTGSASRQCSTAVNEQSFKALNGKVLNVKKDVDGLKIENANTAGRVAALALDIDGIRTEVSAQTGEIGAVKESLTQIQQDAEKVQIRVEDIEDNGVDKVKTGMGYTFDDTGLDISRDGSEMHNLLDETGMYVKRGEETMLQANNNGVVATDVTIRNFLTVGNHARFEQYQDSFVGCFYVEGA